MYENRSERGGVIFLQNFDSESYLGLLDTKAGRCLKLTIEQICKLKKFIALEDTPLDFSIKIQNDYELNEIYKAFEIWLKTIVMLKKPSNVFNVIVNLRFSS